MNLNLFAWKPEDVRSSPRGFQFKLLDFRDGEERWYTKEEIIDICTKDDSILTQIYRNFLDKIEARVEELKEKSELGFTKKVLRRFFDDDEHRFCGGEVIQIYYPNEKGTAGAPELTLRLTKGNIHYKENKIGISKEAYLGGIELNVDNVHLVDEFYNIHFIAPLWKFRKLGKEEWERVFLPVKHFVIYNFGHKTPEYKDKLKDVNIIEKF